MDRTAHRLLVGAGKTDNSEVGLLACFEASDVIVES